MMEQRASTHGAAETAGANGAADVTPPGAADGAALIAGRVQRLVERHHAGDLHAAAAHLGVPLATLADVLSGQWERMRADVLAAVVRVYGVSIEWLVSFGPSDEARPGPADLVTRTPALRQPRADASQRLLQA